MFVSITSRMESDSCGFKRGSVLIPLLKSKGIKFNTVELWSAFGPELDPSFVPGQCTRLRNLRKHIDRRWKKATSVNRFLEQYSDWLGENFKAAELPDSLHHRICGEIINTCSVNHSDNPLGVEPEPFVTIAIPTDEFSDSITNMQNNPSLHSQTNLPNSNNSSVKKRKRSLKPYDKLCKRVKKVRNKSKFKGVSNVELVDELKSRFKNRKFSDVIDYITSNCQNAKKIWNKFNLPKPIKLTPSEGLALFMELDLTHDQYNRLIKK